MKIENKKIIIYGNDKLKEDIEYVFDNVHIERCINESNYKDILSENLDNIVILVCSKDKEKVFQELKNIDLQYNKHFFSVEDFFCNLMFFKNRSVAIWGTGKASDYFLEKSNCQFEFFIDNNMDKKDTIINNKDVKYGKDICEWNDKFIIIASSYYNEIKEDLIKLDLKEYKDFIDFSRILQFKDMLEKLLYTTKTKNITCNWPFSSSIIALEGNVCICCFTGKYPIGNIRTENIEDIWSSTYAKMIRRSVINKTFCYCDPKCNLIELDYLKVTKEEKYPLHINIEMDDTCNLMCPQCRNELKIARGKKREELDYISDKIIKDVIPHAKNLQIANNGEVFFSPAYKKILQSKEIENIEKLFILSNGTLFNESNWKTLEKHNFKYISLNFSIDAATKETYEKLRKGGNFDDLITNMKFAGNLRKNNMINYLKILFVVQKENYKEMIQFVELGKELGVDEINFSRIRNWTEYPSDSFLEISMYDENGNAKPELAEILSNPVFNDSIVKLSLDIIN